MQRWERRHRDFDKDQAQALTYKGFVFPKYEGKLTRDEFHSKKIYYAFWGECYLSAAAIRYRVGSLLDDGRLREAA